MKESIRCSLKILAPTHIGCDEVYEPMGFVMDEEQRQMVVYDPWSFFQQMPASDRKRFAEICRQGTISSILQIYQFLRGRAAVGRAVEVCSGLVQHYRQTLALPLRDERKIQQELNNFTIARTAFLPDDGRPYIPGSALKGALRTAYLNYQAHMKKVPPPRGKGAARELEKILLDGGSFDTDPFRMLKVSDFMPVGEVKTKVMYAINEKKKISKFQARGPYQIIEVIVPESIFIGRISLEEPKKLAGIRTPLRRQTLFESAATFYQGEKSREDNELFEIGIRMMPTPENTSGFLLRLGRHSGAESVTIGGHRTIRIMKGQGEQPEYLDHATTFWLAAEEPKPPQKDQLKPFGWTVAEELSAELEEGYQETEVEYRQQRDQGILELREKKAAGAKEAEIKVESAREIHPEEVWGQATLTWSAGNQQLIATWQNKKAFVQGKHLVPEALHKRLFEKKKTVTVKVTVEPIGNAFRIIKVEEV